MISQNSHTSTETSEIRRLEEDFMIPTTEGSKLIKAQKTAAGNPSKGVMFNANSKPNYAVQITKLLSALLLISLTPCKAQTAAIRDLQIPEHGHWPWQGKKVTLPEN